MLFNAVFEAMVATTTEEIPIDADDRPGFGEVVRQSHEMKVKAIARAQREGKVTSTIPAAALLGFVLAIAEATLDLEPGSRAAAAHRKRIVAAVTRLIES